MEHTTKGRAGKHHLKVLRTKAGKSRTVSTDETTKSTYIHPNVVKAIKNGTYTWAEPNEFKNCACRECPARPKPSKWLIVLIILGLLIAGITIGKELL